ncbi:MAG TPA: hypothetical protein VJ483_05925 [Holophagaceae bacterium]|nr:hypothetical protein [Holophagaceae bacterium]
MSSPLRASALRSAIGGGAMVLALVVAFFLLPDASDTLQQKIRAKEQAERDRDQQKVRTQELQAQADRIARGQQTLEALETRLPKGSAGELQWQLSQTLHAISTKEGVRLDNIKYGMPSREGTKGTGLEALEAEFVVVGVYGNLKNFMLALEGTDLPFAVRDARMEESPEGAKLDVVLRAFRRSTSQQEEP